MATFVLSARGPRGWGYSVLKSLRVFLAVAMLLPLSVAEAPSAGAAAGTTCKLFSGTARVSPGLPIAGSTRLVKPTFSIKDAKLSGCHGTVRGGTVSAKLKFSKRSNCTTLVTQASGNIVSRAKGTLTIVWNNTKTSTFSFSLSFGAVTGKPELAAATGTVTAGLFKGMKGAGTVLWVLGMNECFNGAPLTYLTFSGFGAFVMK